MRWYCTNQSFYKYNVTEEGKTGAVARTVLAHDAKRHGDLVVEEKTPKRYRLRRLTPNECIRLQGLPASWISDVPGPDGAKYKMAGNGIAVPCAVYVLSRVVEAWEEGGS